MGVFPSYGANLPTELWLLARYIQALVILAATLTITRRLKRWWLQFLVVGAITILGLVAIFAGWFPVAFVDGKGLTRFKIDSEYTISLFLAASMILLALRRRTLDRWTFSWLMAAYVLTIASELTFTFYVNLYGISNIIGHLFKVAAYGAVLFVVFQNMFARPVNILRQHTPICSHCKALREKDGSWTAIEVFLASGGPDTLTHGLCPTCAREFYPDFVDEPVDD
jgi:hypothetical protein